MKEILLIRGGDKRHVLDALWVAADLADAFGDDADTQIDIAVPEAHVDYANLGTATRRVIGITPRVGSLSDITKSAEGEGGGGVKKLFSAAKNIASIAGDNLRNYRELAEELRLVNYDTVFDFDSSGFSIAITRMLKKAGEIIAFDEQNIAKPVPGAKLLYHRTHHITGDISDSMRMRMLAGKHFAYTSFPTTREINNTAPAQMPETPYVVIDGKLPDVFMRVFQENGFNIVGGGDDSPVDSMPAAEVAGLVKNAAAVAGNGAVTALSSLLGGLTLFIGDQADMPEGAKYITTPAILADALLNKGGGAAAAPPPPPKPPAGSAPEKPSDSLDAPLTPSAPPPKIKLPGH